MDGLEASMTPYHMDHDKSQASQTQSTSNALPEIAAEDSYFSSAPPRRPQLRPIGLRDLGVILNNKRRVATLQKQIRGAGSAWIDHDDSGTYDPKADRVTPIATPPRRRKRSWIEDESEEDGIPRPPARKSQRRVGYGLPMTFVFTSEKGLKYLRSITPGPFDSQSTTANDEFSESSSDPAEDFGFGPSLSRRKFRRREKTREIPQRDDNLTIDQLTVGHPQRRGCRACFDVGDDDCSLIERGHDYPCTACEDAGIDCELIIPPKFKKSCERCKRKRISCSYRISGGEGQDSCESCKAAEESCFAAPRKSAVRGRNDSPSLPRRQSSEPSAVAPPPRLYVSCNQCRSNSLRCSLRKDQPGPCRNCKKKDEDCAFTLIRPAITSSPTLSPRNAKGRLAAGSNRNQTRKGKKLDQKDEGKEFPTPGRLQKTLLAEALHEGFGKKRHQTLMNEITKKQERVFEKARRKSSRPETPEPSQALGISGGIQHTRITTSFSHPIEFNYIPDPLETSPCSWCSSPFFGLYGLGSRVVEVIPYPMVDGNGYEEIFGGHAENGARSTQMCVTCTFERVAIVGCERHEICPIDVDPRVGFRTELEKSFQALVEGNEVAGQLALDTKWCSICPAPAYFRCCTRQTNEGIENEPIECKSGCGLLLCTNCEDFMKKFSGGGACNSVTILDRMVRECDSNRWIYEEGPRADASFLTSTGELMIRFQKGMGEGDESTNGDGDDDNNDVVNENDDDREEDEEMKRIFERVGKGKGKWMDKDKNIPHNIWGFETPELMEPRKRQKRTQETPTKSTEEKIWSKPKTSMPEQEVSLTSRKPPSQSAYSSREATSGSSWKSPDKAYIKKRKALELESELEDLVRRQRDITGPNPGSKKRKGKDSSKSATIVIISDDEDD